MLVVDDHDVVQWGFRVLLTRHDWVERCLSAATPEEAVELARSYEPHVALVDLFLGDRSGADLCHLITEASPRTRILLMSGAGWISPQAARAAGAAGFVPEGLERAGAGGRRPEGGRRRERLRDPAGRPGADAHRSRA